MVPEGWQKVRLGDLFQNSKEKGKSGLQTMSVTLTDGLVPRDSRERKTDTNLVPEEHLRLRPGYIAYNMMRMWQGASGLARSDSLVSPAYVVLKPTRKVDPLFASYFFKAARTVYLFWAYSYGLTKDRLRLYYPDFSIIAVVVPPVPEQQRIGEVLSTWDRAIQRVEALIDASERQKKALIQQLLCGTTRLPGFGPPASDDSFPSDWSRVSLGQIGHCVTGLTYSPDDVVDDGLLVLRSSNIAGNEIALNDNVYVSTKVSQESLTRVNDILVCVRNGSKQLIGKNALITNESAGLAHGAFMTLFRSDENSYVAHLLQSDMFRRQVHRNLGATINSINTSDLKRFAFPWPSAEERIAIANVLSGAQKEIDLYQKNLSALHQEKQALMQQLLSGERRVKVDRDVERVVQEAAAHG